MAAWHRRLPQCVEPSTISSFVGGGQVKYRQMPTTVAIKWQKRGGIPAHGKPQRSAKRFSRFLGYIGSQQSSAKPIQAAKVLRS
jgi:hypothetical protein